MRGKRRGVVSGEARSVPHPSLLTPHSRQLVKFSIRSIYKAALLPTPISNYSRCFSWSYTETTILIAAVVMVGRVRRK